MPDVILSEPLVVLIVDDDFVQASALARLLTLRVTIAERPLEVIIVQTLAEGLLIAPRANVTLLDLSLPDSTPDNTIVNLRLFRPPVIVMTAFDDPNIRAQAMINGADAFIIKGQMMGICGLVLDAMLKDILLKSGLLPPAS